MRAYNFFVSGPKSTRFFSPNAGGGIAVDHMSFRFLKSCSFPEIFAIEVRSCAQFCRFLIPIFESMAPEINCWNWIIKLNIFLVMWRSGDGSPRSRAENKTSAVKYGIPLLTYGRPNIFFPINGGMTNFTYF